MTCRQARRPQAAPDPAAPENLITDPDPAQRPRPNQNPNQNQNRDRDNESARPLVFANGFALSPYAETGAPGGSLKTPPRTLWHASPGSTTTPK